MLRRFLERLSRHKVVKRRLPPRFGGRGVFVSPDSALQYLKPNLESSNRELFEIAFHRVSRGDVVWDIGANVGMFAFGAAHRAGEEGQVLAVEADPFLASLLQRSVQDASNRDLNVNILCAAVSDKTGLARFMIAERGRSSNSLEESGHRGDAGGTRYVQYVPTTTLDELLNTFRAPNLLKIDVEGAERLVLDGAQRLLTECRPAIYIEVGSQQNIDVTSILQANHYRLYDGDINAGKEIGRCAFNTLAIPSEYARVIAG